MNRIISLVLGTEAGRRIEMQVLMNMFTSSLHLPRRNVLFTPSAQSLDTFATLTARHLGRCSREELDVLHSRALRVGGLLRTCCYGRSHEKLTQLVFLLYRNIGIDMEGSFPAKVTVRQCHFCRHYSPMDCRAASMMDSGIISGIFGGGTLEFQERITEGSPCCLCSLSLNNTKAE